MKLVHFFHKWKITIKKFKLKIRSFRARLIYDHKPTTNLPFKLKEGQTVIIKRNDGKLGDFICFAPFFKELKRLCPGIRIIVLVNQSMYSLYKEIKEIDELVLVKVAGKKISKNDIFNACKGLGDCYLYIHLVTVLLNKDLWYTKYIKPQYVATVDPNLKMNNVSCCDYNNCGDVESKQITYILNNILKCGGLNKATFKYTRFFEEDVLELQKSREYGKVLGINPFGCSRHRHLSDAVIIYLINSALAKTTYDIELFVGPKLRKRIEMLLMESFSHNSRVRLAPVTESYKDVIVHVAAYSAFVGVDTATAHIAASYDIPQLCIYSNDLENFALWHVRSPISINIPIVKPNMYDMYDIEAKDIERELSDFLNGLDK